MHNVSIGVLTGDFYNDGSPTIDDISLGNVNGVCNFSTLELCRLTVTSASVISGYPPASVEEIYVPANMTSLYKASSLFTGGFEDKIKAL